MIDVKNLIKQYSIEEHLRNADDYFKDREYTYLFQKPFHSAEESAPLMQNLGALFELANLKNSHKCQVQTKNVPKCSVKMYHLVTPIC